MNIPILHLAVTPAPGSPAITDAPPRTQPTAAVDLPAGHRFDAILRETVRAESRLGDGRPVRVGPGIDTPVVNDALIVAGLVMPGVRYRS